MATAHAIVTLSYEDLVSFDAKSAKGVSLTDQIGQAFGRSGLGILQVSGVPDFSAKRLALLPLAARLPHLPDLAACVDAASLYSVGWSHGREELAPGRPDLAKGSYYANPLTPDLAAALAERDGAGGARDASAAAHHPEFFAPNVWPTASLPELQAAFTDMGLLLHRVGCLVAKVADAYCHEQQQQHQHHSQRGGVSAQLCSTLQRSLNAKGRLLHYFAAAAAPADTHTATFDALGVEYQQQPWCGWHNDHVRFRSLQELMEGFLGRCVFFII